VALFFSHCSFVISSVQEISKKWTMPVQNWGIIIGQFMMFFEERFKDLKTA